MSNKKAAPAQPKAGTKEIFRHLANCAAVKLIKIQKQKGVLPMIGVIGLVLFLTCCCHAGVYSTAMLYIFANNGKLSGRADGNVYMRNGRIRGFVVPSLVQNTYTQTQRVQLSLLSAAYRALTPADQLSFINLTGLFRSDRFGNPKEVKGKEAYVLLNMNLFNIGVAAISTAPVLEAVPVVTDLTVTATVAGQLLGLAYTPTPTAGTVDHLIYATGPQGAGIFKPSSSKYRLIGVLPNGTASPFAAGALYTAKFGAFVAGQKIFVKLVGIHNVTGQAGAALSASDVAA